MPIRAPNFSDKRYYVFKQALCLPRTEILKPRLIRLLSEQSLVRPIRGIQQNIASRTAHGSLPAAMRGKCCGICSTASSSDQSSWKRSCIYTDLQIWPGHRMKQLHLGRPCVRVCAPMGDARALKNKHARTHTHVWGQEKWVAHWRPIFAVRTRCGSQRDSLIVSARALKQCSRHTSSHPIVTRNCFSYAWCATDRCGHAEGCRGCGLRLDYSWPDTVQGTSMNLIIGDAWR